MLEFLVFRHGETDWNRARRLQGHTDIPLNEEGRAQAAQLAKRVLDFRPQIILSSDLSRARETAAIVNHNLSVPLLFSEALRECHLGEIEGWAMSDVLSRFGESYWLTWKAPQPLDFRLPGGESKHEHLLRVRQFLENFADREVALQRVAVSTHGGSLLRLVHHCEGAPVDEPVPIPNGAAYRVSFCRTQRSWRFLG